MDFGGRLLANSFLTTAYIIRVWDEGPCCRFNGFLHLCFAKHLAKSRGTTMNKHLLMDVCKIDGLGQCFGIQRRKRWCRFWVDKKLCFGVVGFSCHNRSLDYASKKKRVRYFFGARPAETCWQESTRRCRDSRQCWLKLSVLIEGPRENVGRRFWVFKCQIK